MKSRNEKDKEIIASVKREMEMPRLAASVRNSWEVEAALAVRAHAVRAVRE
ncbi:MAG: hypothetical protein WCA89_04750 [Terracidiphilus sp.]